LKKSRPRTPRTSRADQWHSNTTGFIGAFMESKFLAHVDRDEIVEIVCELVRHNTVNPPGNEYLCKEIVTRCIQSLGMEVSYYEKEPGRTNVVGRIGSGTKS